MTIFHCLPHVEKFLWCISLKVGSIFIVILSFFSVVEAIFGSGLFEFFNKCYLTGLPLKILGYIAIAVAIIVLFTAINFFYGIAKGFVRRRTPRDSNIPPLISMHTSLRVSQGYPIRTLMPDPAVRFMYACLLLLLYNLTVSFTLFVEESVEGCCRTFVLGTVTLIYSLMLCYFLVILASFHRIAMFV